MLGYLFPSLLAVLATVATARCPQLLSQRSAAEAQLREALQRYGLHSPSGFKEQSVSVVGASMQLASNQPVSYTHLTLPTILRV